MTKPSVIYDPKSLSLYHYNGTLRASLVPKNHPDEENVVNGMVANTTAIQWIDAVTGVFETKNTIYTPAYMPSEPLNVPAPELPEN